MLPKSFLLSALIILLSVPAYPVQVSFFLGDVSMVRKGKKSPVSVGSTLNSGDIVKTGKGAFIEILYKDGTKIKINESSSATIGSKNIAGSDQIAVTSGSMTGTFKKLMKGSNKVYSPTIIASVRGTEFTVTVSDGGDTRVDLSEGVLDLSNPYGSTTIKKNEKAESVMGAGPSDSKGTSADWKKKSDANFARDPAAKSEDAGRYIDTFSDRSKDIGGTIPAVSSAVKDAKDKDSLEKAETLLNDASEKAQDDMGLNEALQQTLELNMEKFRGKDDTVYDKYRSAANKSGIVEKQQKRNLDSLNKIREEYRKAYDRIMGRYKNKVDEIKSRFKNKKSDM